jgi:hypothetical protein
MLGVLERGQSHTLLGKLLVLVCNSAAISSMTDSISRREYRSRRAFSASSNSSCCRCHACSWRNNDLSEGTLAVPNLDSQLLGLLLKLEGNDALSKEVHLLLSDALALLELKVDDEGGVLVEDRILSCVHLRHTNSVHVFDLSV